TIQRVRQRAEHVSAFLLKHGHGTAKPGCESRNSLRKGNPQDQKRQPHDLSRRQPTNGRFRKTCVRSQKVEAISEKCSSVFNELVYDRELLRPFPRNARLNRKNVR